MGLKQRVLAHWRIPITDPRLGKMNAARWVCAHEMYLDKERWAIRQWARMLGIDMDSVERYGDDELPENLKKEQPIPFGEIPKIFPLAGILNPEAYSNFIKQYRNSEEMMSEIPEDIYEQQVRALEENNLLSDIDVISDEVEKRTKEKKLNSILGENDNING